MSDQPERARRSRHRFLAVVVLVALGAGAAYWFSRPGVAPAPGPETGVEPAAEPWYRDVTAGSGLDFTYRNGEEAGQFTILESLGGGIGLIDYDGDGRLDIFATGGGTFEGPQRTEIRGRPCKLYRNLGGWKFEDATAKTGLDGVAWWYTHGVAVADYDRDGWADLLVTGYGRIALFRNESDGAGGRRFADVTARVGLKDHSWSTSAGWADVDGDGFPDLYVCHYVDWSFANHPACPGQKPGVVRDVCPPQRFQPLVHSLFRNEGGRSFRDTAAEHKFEPTGCGLGVVLADLNDDGRPDIYVANDATNNYLFLNRGGRLEERGNFAGVAIDDVGKYNGSMGVDAADYDGSGRASLWVTNFQGELPALYRNLGRESFQHVSRAAGVGAIGQHLVGFGTAFLDADGDGWEDIIGVNGHVLQFPSLGSTMRQRPVLLRNTEFENRRFYRDLGAAAGPFFETPAVGRGLAVGDLDNDGRPDVVVSHSNSPVVLLRNVVGERAPARWLGLRLTGRGHRDVAGTTVRIETDTRVLTRFVKGGGSYLSAGDPRLLVGLGPTGTVKRVTVKWAWGETQSWDNLGDGAYWELREGEPVPKKDSTSGPIIR